MVDLKTFALEEEGISWQVPIKWTQWQMPSQAAAAPQCRSETAWSQRSDCPTFSLIESRARRPRNVNGWFPAESATKRYREVGTTRRYATSAECESVVPRVPL